MASQGQGLGTSLEKDCSMDFRQKLLRIDADLGTKDVEALKFLCRDLLSHKKLEKCDSALDIFDLLLKEEQLNEKDHFFLAELLYLIKQKALLRFLNYTKEQVQHCLPTRRTVSLFRNLLYELSEDIDSESLRSMIFLLPNALPKTEMTSLSFLEHLEKQALLGEDNLEILEKVCKSTLPSLMKKIERYKKEKSDRATNGAPVEMRGTPDDITYPETSTKVAALYPMDGKHRGYCVIVNNHMFTSFSPRQGTHLDVESLRCVFEWLGFKVQVYNDVTKADQENLLQKYRSHPDHADGDCFVFCILTHGKYGKVYSSDGALTPIQEIMSYFTAQQCPGLACKPKLFFIQACQGEEIQPSVSIEADAMNPDQELSASRSWSLSNSIPNEADFLLGLATIPGYLSFRNVKKGSWFIQSLCKHLKDLVPRHEDILSILTAVNNDVSQQESFNGTKKQMPQPAFTLRKSLVFPVPQEALYLK